MMVWGEGCADRIMFPSRDFGHKEGFATGGGYCSSQRRCDSFGVVAVGRKKK